MLPRSCHQRLLPSITGCPAGSRRLSLVFPPAFRSADNVPDPNQPGITLGGGFECDLVAEGLELADVMTPLVVGVDPGVVEVRAKVMEGDVWIAEQMPDDDEHRAANRDDLSCLSRSIPTSTARSL
jgi:hypothetical protein